MGQSNDKEKTNPIPDEILNPWLSNGYNKLFDVKIDTECNVAVEISNILDVLNEGLCNEFNDLVHLYINETVTPLSSYAISRLNQKCTYLSLALEIVMNSYQDSMGVSWLKCCNTAIKTLQHVPMGIGQVTSGEVVRRWFTDFKNNDRKFIVPSVSMKSLKSMEIPPLLQIYPDLKDAITDFCNRNIGDITVTIMAEYINKCFVTNLISHTVRTSTTGRPSFTKIEVIF